MAQDPMAEGPTTADESRLRELIAQRLRTARELAGLSQGQVAEMMGWHRPTVSEIEAGRRRVAAEELVALAHIYRVSLTWLSGSNTGQEELSDRVSLAARDLDKLKPEDLETVLRLVRALRPREET